MSRVVILAGGDGKRGPILRRKLRSCQYRVKYCQTLSNFYAAISHEKVATIILLFPDKFGIIDELFSKITPHSVTADLPVIFISSSSTENNIVRSLAYKADEFLIEPVLTKEIAKLIDHTADLPLEYSRERQASPDNEAEHLLIIGNLILNKETLIVSWRNRNLPLYPLQVHVLEFLMKNPGRPITRIELLSRVWKKDIDLEGRTVDRNIKRIRDVFKRKAGVDPIRTIRYVGYEFDDQFEQLPSRRRTRA